MSHVEQDVIEEVINTVESYFLGLSIERVNMLNFLGMEIEFKGNKTFSLSLVKYITNMIEELKEILKKFGEHLDRTYAHPAVKDLFTIKDNTAKLSKEKAEIFCTFVAKILWAESEGTQMLNSPCLSSAHE